MQVITPSGVSHMAPPSRVPLSADTHPPFLPAADAATETLARYRRWPTNAIQAPYEFEGYDIPPGATRKDAQASPNAGISVSEAAGWLVDLSAGGLYSLAMTLVGRLAQATPQIAPQSAQQSTPQSGLQPAPADADAGHADAQAAMTRPARQAREARAAMRDGSTGAHAGSHADRPQRGSLRPAHWDTIQRV
jgi:hypothetical protein